MFHIRAEVQGGKNKYTQAPGRTIEDARTAFENTHPALAPFLWRGAVVFCQGTRPAEESTQPAVVKVARLSGVQL